MNLKKSLKLFVAFWVVFFCLGICIGINSTLYAVRNNLDVMDLPVQSKLIIGVVCLAVFCPWLLVCSHYAKKEKEKAVRVISIILCLHILVCTLAMMYPLIFS